MNFQTNFWIIIIGVVSHQAADAWYSSQGAIQVGHGGGGGGGKW